MIKKFIAIIGVHFLLAVGVFAYYNADQIKKLNESPIHSSAPEQEQFTITVNNLSDDIDPIAYDFYGKRELAFTYESLVDFDDHFAIKPALAVSWGMISETEWQFNLRKEVVFHDGSEFNADDVIATLERARSNSNSLFKDFLLNIESIEKVDEFTIKINTADPMPTLLSELTNIYITPEEQVREGKVSEYIGTGPFKLKEIDEKKVNFQRNEQYWKNPENYPKNLILQKKENKYARLGQILGGETQVLADVPPIFIEQIKNNSSVKIIESPGIKSVFLLFNPETEFLQNKNNQQALNIAINREKIKELIKGIKLTSQFAGSGIFGYKPDIELPVYNLQKAKEIIEIQEERIFELNLTGQNLVLGQFLKEQFEQLDIRININTISEQELVQSMKEKTADFYLIGWDFSKGSTDDFLRDFVFSSSELNLLEYSNEELDKYIKKSLFEVDEEKRLKALQEAMEIIITKDMIGLPLFAIDNLLAYLPSEYNISIRSDGIIHF